MDVHEVTADERFEALISHGRDVVLFTDSEGTIGWASPTVTRVLGHSIPDVLGTRVSDLVDPADLAMAQDWRDRLLGTVTDPRVAGGTSRPIRFRRADGSLLWCTVSAVRTRDADGNLSGISAVIHDVDDLVKAQTRVTRGEALLSAVIEAQIDPHMLLRAVRTPDGEVADFEFLMVNAAAASFEGLAAEDLIGRTMIEALPHLTEAADDVVDCRAVLESGEPRIFTDWAAVDYLDEQGRTRILDVWIVKVGPDLISYSYREVTDQHNARQELAEAHTMLRAVFDTMIEPHAVFRAIRDETGEPVDFLFEDANQAAADFEGYPLSDLIGSTIRQLYRDAEEAESDIADCARVLRTRTPVSANDVPSRNYTDGQGRPVVVDIRIVPVDDGRVSYAWRDVTERRRSHQVVEDSERRFRLLAENMSDVVMLINSGLIEWVSPSVTTMWGWLPEDLIGAQPWEIVHPDDQSIVSAAWSRQEGSIPRMRYRVRAKAGNYHWVDAEGRSVSSSAGPRMTVLSSRVVDAEVSALEALEDMAKHDELTGLVNRHEVFRQIGRSLAGPVRTGTRVAMAFCDLDGFKAVNDAYGHSAGDALLRAIARRLERTVRSGDVVARLGGDEILVVLNGVHDLDDALRVAESLRAQVRLPTLIPGGTVSVTASIGVALAEAGESVDNIIARADASMYEAKRSGKDRVLAIPS